jgi:hypothetical protein
VKVRRVRVTDRATSGVASGIVELIGWLIKERLRVEQESAQPRLGMTSIEARATNTATSLSNARAIIGKIEPDAVCT